MKYVDFKDQPSGIYACIFISLAFWVKGPAAFVFFPGWLLYLLLTRRFKSFWFSKITLIGIGLIILSVLIWIMTTIKFGNEFTDRPFQGKSNIETLFLYDIIARFFNAGEIWEKPNYFFLITSLDAKFSVWIYLGYGLLALSLFQQKFRKVFRKGINTWFHLFCFLTWLSLAMFLNFAGSKHPWYLAPIYPFIGINLWGLIEFYQRDSKVLKYIVAAVFLLTFVTKVEYFSNIKEYDRILIENETTIRQADKIIFIKPFRRDRVLFAHFQNENCLTTSKVQKTATKPGFLYVIDAVQYDNSPEDFADFSVIDKDEKSVILKKL